MRTDKKVQQLQWNAGDRMDHVGKVGSASMMKGGNPNPMGVVDHVAAVVVVVV
jgi:hypothetical protein